MKTLFTFMLGIIICINLFCQASGNWYYQKSKSSESSTLYREYDINTTSGIIQSAYNYYYSQPANDTVIYLEVKAIMNVRPDAFIMILGVSQVAKDLEAAYDLMDQRINAFINEIGVDKKDIYVDFISQTPIFSREKEKKIFSKKLIEVPKGYELKKNIHIYYKERSLSDYYIKIAAKNEIYDVIRVEHIVTDQQSPLKILRGECVKLLKVYTQELAELGISFDANFKSIEESSYCIFPNNQYTLFTSYMPINYEVLSPNSTEITYVNPNEKINLFYDRLSYSNFDIVINPDIVEPCVQFIQKMKFKLVLKKK